MNSATANIIVIIAWAITTYMVMNLLGGTFDDGRSCQTLCVNLMYWAALALAVIGTALSLFQVVKSKTGLISKLFLLAGLALCGKLIGVMVIGTLTL